MSLVLDNIEISTSLLHEWIASHTQCSLKEWIISTKKEILEKNFEK